MDFWTPKNFAKVTGGSWLAAADPDVMLSGVGTNSREIRPREAFIALKGAKFDGHDFLDAAARSGAALLIVSDEAKARAFLSSRQENAERSAGVLLVADTLAALQQLAAAYRDTLAAAGCKVIAVVGSNGKTTTRNLIHTALSATLKGTQSPKSFNNHIGVPLTILSTRIASQSTHASPTQQATAPPAGDQFVVVEVGTNHPGEIESLAQIVRPDIAVVTSIGEEHMEFFGTLDGVAREEAAILKYVKPDGAAVIEGAVMESYFQRLGLLPPHLEVVIYGRHAQSVCDFSDDPQVIQEDAAQTFTVDGGAVRVTLPLVGRYNAVNALAALCVGRRLGVQLDAMAAALARTVPVEMRLNVRRLASAAGAITIINDAYNANLASVTGAIMTLRQFALPAGGRRVAILGDMFELGAYAPDLHRSIGRTIAERDTQTWEGEPDRNHPKIHLVIFIGQLSLFAAEALAKLWSQDRIVAFPIWDDSVPAQVAALLRGGDTVLIKASRGMKLERLLPAIEEKFR